MDGDGSSAECRILPASGIAFWSVWIAVVFGAFVGDWLAYELAMHFKDQRASPFSRLRLPLSSGAPVSPA